ncbi:MAG: 30S ribosomal protein S8 [Gammaproteobacteria bacterium]|nr:30S ribosomal protein S8 [Gammaproteobacteria bacterium]
MSMTDPIADLLTRVRNGQKARKVSVTMPGSRLKRAVVQVLKDEGYITGFAESQDDGKPVLTVELKYHNGEPVIATLDRVSRPGLRVYRSMDELPKVLGGLGVAIVSTSDGVMSDREARKRGQGGEVICTVS